MDKLSKIFDLLNSLLIKLGEALFGAWCSIIPSKILEKYHIFIEKKENLKKRISDYISVKISICVNKIKFWFKQAKELYSKYKAINFKAIMAEKIFKLKIMIKTHSPFDLVKIFYHHHMVKPIRKINKYDFTDLKFQVRLASIGIFLIAIGSAGIYYGGNHIYEKEVLQSRAPASAPTFKASPDYKKFTERTLLVQQIRIPVFIESVREIKSVTIDFTVRTSTRFALYYLSNYEYKLKDYFFTNVDPVISTFALTTESKDILKEKIIEAVNNFLTKENVEGHAIAVEVTYVVGT